MKESYYLNNFTMSQMADAFLTRINENVVPLNYHCH